MDDGIGRIDVQALLLLPCTRPIKSQVRTIFQYDRLGPRLVSDHVGLFHVVVVT